METQKQKLKRLREVLKECRRDMHEPDNQGIDAVVSGYHLDNAFGDNPLNNAGELTVGIKTETDPGVFLIEWFNLADIIAFARQ